MKFTKFASIVLVLAMLVSTAAFAANDTNPNINAYQESYNSYGQEILGTSDNITGILLPDVESSLVGSARASSELFQMSATEVYQLLTTYNASGKSFMRSDLSNGYLKVSGTVTHTYGDTDILIKVGACYYDIQTDTFLTSASISTHFNSEISDDAYFGYLGFGSQTTYYGFIRNINYGNIPGYVYGSMTFYNSTNS